jgi:hypothetical protein
MRHREQAGQRDDTCRHQNTKIGDTKIEVACPHDLLREKRAET